MNLYIADLHFGHSNIILHDHRPFADADTMDKCLIDLWNGRVSNDDHVYILGDFCYRSGRDPEWYLQKLSGHKHFIIGNHDRHLLKNEKAMSYFESVEALQMIRDGENEIILCHYPIAEWNGYFHGSWHIYGHIHASRNEAYEFMRTKERALNAGCMINDYTPASFNELIRNNRIFRERTGK